MLLIEEIEAGLNSKSNIFDFLSLSLFILKSRVPELIDDLTEFVCSINDNTDIHENIRSNICKELSEPLLPFEQFDIIKGIFISACKSEIDEMHQLSVLYSVLLGINSAAKFWSENSLTSWGPLDTDSKHKIRVYLRPHFTLLSSFENGVYRHRNVEFNELIDTLDSFVFLDISELKLKRGQGVPQGKFVRPGNHNWKRGKLRVGIVPLCCDKNFEFKYTNVGINTDKAHVVYLSESEQRDFSLRAKKALQKASKYKCNIVIFPEFTCSEQLKDAIRDTLEALNRRRSSVPDLVFAGTNWTSGNENVLSVFNGQGFEIGRYYKRDRYDDTDKDTGKRVYEDLHNGWKEIDFYGLPGIGFIMPVICKDAMVEDGPADLFSKIFLPIVIPSWSPSVNSFERLTGDAKDNFTSFIMADACSAVHKEGTFSVGMSVIVTKKNTVVRGQTKEIKKKDCNLSDCNQGCLEVLEYDFKFVGRESKGDHPKHNTSVKRIEQ